MATIKRALISVSDKHGIVDFARTLRKLKVEILSTGGTAKLLADSGIPVIEVGELYHDPACMAIVATDLLPFLYGETAFFALSSKTVNDNVLEAIHLPESLRVNKEQSPNAQFARIREWIDPMLPDSDPEPYTKGLDINQVKTLFQQ